MKKTIVALLLVLCMAALFAATTKTQTIVLVSVVEETKPCFSLDVAYVKNGYAFNSGDEVSIHSYNVKEDVQVKLNVWQDFSNYKGKMGISISVSELSCGSFSTSGLSLSGNVTLQSGGCAFVNFGNIEFSLNYDGRPIGEEVVAEVYVNYNGNSLLPEGEYVSYIRMTYEAE